MRYLSAPHREGLGRRETSHGVRIGLGPPRERDRLEQALQTLAELLREGPDESFGAIV